MESRQQHPHRGLTSAASLQDAAPRALGHRQRREYLREETAQDSQTPEQMRYQGVSSLDRTTQTKEGSVHRK